MNRYEIELEENVKKYIKKIKDIKLKEIIINNIYNKIQSDPNIGDKKSGDLKGILTVSFKYQSSQYRIAYVIKNNKIPIILCGLRQNFYNKLRRLIQQKKG